jgi:mycobactin lysine-N-oxygenase
MQALASLAVVGAGPKGLAIAAKRAALARTGRKVPDLVLIDRAGVAANWSGTSGYTDGRQPLSTPPEKDVGFPYAPNWGPASGQVSDEVRRRSWQRYLIDQGGLADWVDRGQPRPDHRAWHRVPVLGGRTARGGAGPGRGRGHRPGRRPLAAVGTANLDR